MAIRKVFYDDYNTGNWDVTGDWYTLKNQLIGVDKAILAFSSTDTQIRVTLPTDDVINFYKDGVNYVLDYNASQQTAAHNGDTDITIELEADSIKFEWASGSFSEDVVYPFFQLAVNSSDKESIEIYKDFEDNYADNFITGVGYNSLQTYIEGSKIYVEPGYFYIGNQEYYMFNQMVVKTITGPMSACYDYVEGSTYFIVPDANIDEDFGYVKTPNNLEYSVEWEDTTPSGYVPDVQSNITGYKLVYEGDPENPREITPSGIPSGILPVSSGILPIINDESYLVITDVIGEVSKLEHNSVWIAYSYYDQVYKFYTYVEDEYGSPLVGKSVTWKYTYDGGIPTVIETSVTDARGVASSEFGDIGDWENGFFIWAETNSSFRHSEPQWVQVITQQEEFRTPTFQLDNPGCIWDAQPARTAMGYNIWEDPWGVDPSGLTGVYVPNWGPVVGAPGTAYDFTIFEPPAAIGEEYVNTKTGTGITSGQYVEKGFPYECINNAPLTWSVKIQSQHQHWESNYAEYQRPPMGPGVTTTFEIAPPTYGYFNIDDYCSASGVIPSGYFDDVWPDMRVSVNGYWGQFIIGGSTIQDNAALQARCQNPAVGIYFIDRVADYDGNIVFGTSGSFNDVKTGSSSYRELYYVVYYHGSDYYKAYLDESDINYKSHGEFMQDILDGNADFYFRGIAIYPIPMETNLEDAYKQDWKISEIISLSHIVE